MLNKASLCRDGQLWQASTMHCPRWATRSGFDKPGVPVRGDYLWLLEQTIALDRCQELTCLTAERSQPWSRRCDH